VNETPLAEIWRGRRMRHIRKELAAQRFPHECRSGSCPIFRGDRDTYLLRRMDGEHHELAGTAADPHAGARTALAGSELRIERAEAAWRATLDLRWSGAPLDVDLFVAVVAPGGEMRFQPDDDESLAPFALDLRLDERTSAAPLPLLERAIDHQTPVGRCWVGAALFVDGGNPTARADCLWAGCASIVIDG
jgi:hypothetical protein